MLKKSFAVFLSILLMCLCFAPTATIASDVRPMWDYITSYRNTFYISKSGKATVEVIIDSFHADGLSVEANLQQYKDGRWTTIKSWSEATYNKFDCCLSEAWYVVSGYSYRIVSTGKAYVDGDMVEETTYKSDPEYY